MLKKIDIISGFNQCVPITLQECNQKLTLNVYSYLHCYSISNRLPLANLIRLALHRLNSLTDKVLKTNRFVTSLIPVSGTLCA